MPGLTGRRLPLYRDFRRPAGALPAAEVTYYASADSTVHCVLYDWEEAGGANRRAALGRTLDRVTEALSAEIGAPEVLDREYKPFRFERGETVYERRNVRWTRGSAVVASRVIYSPNSNREVRTVIYWVLPTDA